MWDAIIAHPGQAIGWAFLLLTLGALAATVALGLGRAAAHGDLQLRHVALRRAAERHLHAFRAPARMPEGEFPVDALRRIGRTVREQDEATAALRRELSYGQ